MFSHILRVGYRLILRDYSHCTMFSDLGGQEPVPRPVGYAVSRRSPAGLREQRGTVFARQPHGCGAAEHDKGYEAGLKSFARADRDEDFDCIDRHRQDLEKNSSGYRQDMATLTEENLNSAWNLGDLEGFDAARRA